MTDETMIERVARAIHAKFFGRDGTAWSDDKPMARDLCLELARAAIGAMREPTKAMIEAGYSDDPTERSRYTGDVWEDMIAAALGDDGETPAALAEQEDKK